ITFDPLVCLIYKNNKKEKRVMNIKEIPKFCDAILKKGCGEGERFNLDVKHGYAYLNKDDARHMMFYEEYIQERLRHREQMRRWESYVHERTLEQRRERPE
nr:hypothetical protein [Tanacetum cinerariifolium]